MAGVPSKVLTLSVVLCLVTPTAVTDSQDDCLDGSGGSYCPAGSHVYLFEYRGGEEEQCVLCEKGRTYRSEVNRCLQCLPCSVCPDGYRVKEECTRTANTTCEPIPEEPTSTPGVPTTVVTNSTREASSARTQSTEPRQKGSTTEGPKEQLSTDRGYAILFYVCSVFFLFLVICFGPYHLFKRRQWKREIAELKDGVLPLSPTPTEMTSPSGLETEQDEEDGSTEGLLDGEATEARDTNGNRPAAGGADFTGV